MATKHIGRAFFLSAASALLWAAAPGCAPSVGVYCDKVCSCTGCDEEQRADCIDTVEDARKQADQEGCASQFGDLLSCVDGATACDDAEAESSGCGAENQALYECSPDIVGLGVDACQAYLSAYIAKLEECGQVIPDVGSEDFECTPELAKQSTCFKQCLPLLDCGCLLDPSGGNCTRSLQDYSDCAAACF